MRSTPLRFSLAARLRWSLLAAAIGLAPAIIRWQASDHSELEEHMEGIEDAIKHLRRSLRDPANLERSLELVVTLQTETFACKALTPSMAVDVPEPERAAFITAYRRTIVDFLDAELELEAALLDGDADATSAAFARVRGLEDTGHERFTRDED